MKSLSSLLIALSLAFAASNAAGMDLSFSDRTKVMARARALQAAALREDAETVVAYTSDVILRTGISREGLLQMTKATIAQVRMMGLVIERSELGTPSEVYVADGKLVCFLPYKHSIRNGTRTGRSIGYLIAVRGELPSEWAFLDAAILRSKPELLGKLLPGLPSDIQYPDNRNEFDQ